MRSSLETIWKLNLYSMYINYIKIQHWMFRKPPNFLMHSAPDRILQQLSSSLGNRGRREDQTAPVVTSPALHWVWFVRAAGCQASCWYLVAALCEHVWAGDGKQSKGVACWGLAGRGRSSLTLFPWILKTCFCWKQNVDLQFHQFSIFKTSWVYLFFKGET